MAARLPLLAALSALFHLLLSSSPTMALDSVNSDVTVTEATRTIDLTSQLVKESLALTLQNGGSGAVKTVHFAVQKEMADKAVFVGATVSICTYVRTSLKSNLCNDHLSTFFDSLDPKTRPTCV